MFSIKTYSGKALSSKQVRFVQSQVSKGFLVTVELKAVQGVHLSLC
jgi:hypothetical protein